MDRPKKLARSRQPWLLALGLVLLVGGATVWIRGGNQGGRTLRVLRNRVTLSTVRLGLFEHYLPLRGQVAPLRTVYIETAEGGRVEEILVEDGALVQKGQPLLRLSNPALQLELTSRRIRVSEQLDAIRSIELEVEQSRLEHRRALVEANYQIARLDGQRARRRELAKSGAVGEEELLLIESELSYWVSQKKLTREALRLERKLQENKLAKLQDMVDELNRNLEVAQQNVNRLDVSAEVDGKLTAFDVELGQNLTPGTRIAHIDVPGKFKISALIDEFYLQRAQVGQQATLRINQEVYPLQLKKLYSQVREGQFEADFLFVEGQPQDIRKGQTLTFQLQFGASEKRLLVPNSAFYADTGGSWMFVLNGEGVAQKRMIRLGRRNSRYIEVIDGLKENDEVVTSSYSGYEGIDTLLIK